MFLGQKIKQQRLNLNMNQTELSAGICTQTVISKLENLNLSPSNDILIKLCIRLGITLNDVYSEFSNLPTNNLVMDKIHVLDELLQNDNFSDAKELSGQISSAELSKEVQIHYHYQLGRIAYGLHDDDEAIFQYYMALQLSENRKLPFWKLLIYIGMANIYTRKSATDKVHYYLNLAANNYYNLSDYPDENYVYYLEAITRLAQDYCETERYNEGLELISQAVKPRHGYLSTKYTDKLFFLSAKCKLHLSDLKRNTLSHDLTMAIAFADFNQNQPLLDEINQLMAENNIRELKIKP